jgi:ferric-dicitrate binding protein FerR (iron transport regulator)
MSAPPPPPRRYGCLERREDAELAVSGRLSEAARERYEDHCWRCRPCREAHELLAAIYRGPAAPRRQGLDAEAEFSAILTRVAEAKRASVSPLGALGLAGLVAMALTVALFLWSRAPSGSPFSPSSLAPIAYQMPDDPVRPLGHPAMLYGRALHGSGKLLDPAQEPIDGGAFRVGTTLVTEAGESLQAQLLGRMLINITPNTRLRWAAIGNGRVDLELLGGNVAIRYEREPEDPLLVVHTPSADVHVVGTVFTVSVSDGGDAEVAVLRGRVEVREPGSEQTISEVWAGNRFDVKRSFHADVGRHEVAVALPLSYETRGRRAGAVDGGIPTDWVVPGLPDEPRLRNVDNIVEITGSRRQGRVLRASARSPRGGGDDGQALLEMLLREVEATRAEALQAELSRCRELYLTVETRYRAAQCLGDLVALYGARDQPEVWLLIGGLRMDYAGDYQAAKADFRRFLELAPEHPEAELARYRLWLASTEQGNIQEAIAHGREYLRAHPTGRFVGQVLRRFPGLTRELQP